MNTFIIERIVEKHALKAVFEVNDKETRTKLVEGLTADLEKVVAWGMLHDFVVICDETNNTPARIDRNELWVDIAIEPVKAVEFIYIPLRVKNTGEI